ncbi:MAG: DUF2189 domain-containing protein [Alphaproteobacteria bacterium]|nr:DUF2189 domain-containing protein [Alphaproteobacteria bacterium]
MATIKNPIEWSGAQLVHVFHALGFFGHSLHHIEETVRAAPPQIRRIGFGDVEDAIRRGFEDFKAYRTDVIVVGFIYAVVGLVLARLTFSRNIVPLLFPLASGFAIVGPIAALGLFEMSRRRELGAPVRWANGVQLVREPAFGSVVALAAVLIALFLAWLAAAWLIYKATLGPAMPSTTAAFVHDIFATHAGHVMIVVGLGAGLVFALLAMTISVVSFPLLIDRDVGFNTAVATSAAAVWRNPLVMAGWGAVVAASLVVGSLPFFVGLAVVFPVLGHATWHLYRKLVV